MSGVLLDNTAQSPQYMDSSTHEPDEGTLRHGDKEGQSTSADFGIDQYMTEVKAIPRLSHHETIALFRALHEKKRSLQEALDSTDATMDSINQLTHNRKLKREVTEIKGQLVTHNLRLVVYLAHRYQGRGVSIQDLIQEGNIGLIHSIDRFDYRLGNRFSTYAAYWIRQAILTAIYKQGSPVRVPIYIFDKLRRHDRRANTLAQRCYGEGEKKSPTEDREKHRDEIRQLKELMKHPLPLESESNEDGIDLIEVTEDDNQPTPEERVMIQDLTEKLRAAMANLTLREKAILELRFGMDSHEAHTLKQLGQLFNLTKERIRQIESKALNRLSRYISAA